MSAKAHLTRKANPAVPVPAEDFYTIGPGGCQFAPAAFAVRED
jgi:hypothetical protein